MRADSVKLIDGALFEKLVVFGAHNLKTCKKEINDLNVFPIPDGDTGDNMYMTISGGISPLKAEGKEEIGAKAAALAHGMLLNARGNSGVILSQLFAGIAKGLAGAELADVALFGAALQSGVAEAYSAVARPVEGTVLTVAREGVEYAVANITEACDACEFFEALTAEMHRSLERTPDLLPALAEAGVIDSGGAGLIAIFEGMKAALSGEELAESEGFEESRKQELDFSKFDENSVMTFGYCTELLLRLQRAKTDPEAFDVNVIIDFLSTVGDSIVAFKTGSVVKLHVHTMKPHKVLEFCQRFGEFLTVKIENMTLQHNDTDESFATKRGTATKKKQEHKPFAVVTVVSGEGISETFRELGADFVIDGGQGNNPSAERFIEAFDTVNAEHVFVLPNNGNIVMAAKQAANMYTGADVRVIETKNLGQAYSILSALDLSGNEPDAIAEAMREDMKSSVTGMVSSSIRSAKLNGVDIECGDYVGFTDKTMLVSGAERVEVLMELAEALGARERSFMIVFAGVGASEEDKAAATSAAAERFPNTEFYLLDGGQDVYDFITILE